METIFEKARRPRRLSEEVAAQIEEAVLERRLEVGDRLPSERDMAQSFNISKRTLREAMRVVEQKGLIRITQQGAYVKEPSTDKLAQGLALLIRRGQVDWRQIMDFRRNLDTAIARAAAAGVTAEDRSALDRLLTEGERLLGGPGFDWSAYLDLDIRIHLRLARMSANPINEWLVSTFLENMSGFFDTYRDKEQGFSRRNWQNLKALIEAVKAGDATTAAEEALAHLELGSEYVGR